MKPLVSFLAGAVIFSIVGFISGRALSGGLGVSSDQAQLQKLQMQVEAAKKLFPPPPADMRSIIGTVKEVKENALVVETFSSNPFDDTPRIRTITAGENTSITRNEQKDPAVYQEELAEFQKAIQAQSGQTSGTPPVPPSPVREVSVELSDVKPGMQATVTAEENIRDKESFEAKTIQISQGAAVGPAGAVVLPGGPPPGVTPPAPVPLPSPVPLPLSGSGSLPPLPGGPPPGVTPPPPAPLPSAR